MFFVENIKNSDAWKEIVRTIKRGDRIFLISPVRNVTPEVSKNVAAYVAKLEAKGHRVHWPERDTNQVDPEGGINICKQNRQKATKWATCIHIWFDPTSTGSIFDLGMAFATNQRLVIANSEEVTRTEKKGFNNVILSWSAQGKS